MRFSFNIIGMHKIFYLSLYASFLYRSPEFPREIPTPSPSNAILFRFCRSMIHCYEMDSLMILVAGLILVAGSCTTPTSTTTPVTPVATAVSPAANHTSASVIPELTGNWSGTSTGYMYQSGVQGLQ